MGMDPRTPQNFRETAFTGGEQIQFGRSQTCVLHLTEETACFFSDKTHFLNLQKGKVKDWSERKRSRTGRPLFVIIGKRLEDLKVQEEKDANGVEQGN